jgi:hypothetical protein
VKRIQTLDFSVRVVQGLNAVNRVATENGIISTTRIEGNVARLPTTLKFERVDKAKQSQRNFLSACRQNQVLKLYPTTN